MRLGSAMHDWYLKLKTKICGLSGMQGVLSGASPSQAIIKLVKIISSLWKLS